MILSGRRIILIAAIAAVALAIIFLPLITSLSSSSLEKVNIELMDVKLGKTITDTQSLPLDIVFKLTNPTDQTLTTSKIDYELFADGKSLGRWTLSYEDIPPNGRPGLYSNQPINLTSPIKVQYSDSIADIYSRISDNEQITWSVQGVAQIESALTLAEKEFSDEI